MNFHRAFWLLGPTASHPGSSMKASASTLPAPSWCAGASGSRRSSGSGLVAERELRVLGHHLRSPRRVEDELRVDAADALEVADELAHLLGDLRADRAAGRGQSEGEEELRVEM